jgi:regulatory protein
VTPPAYPAALRLLAGRDLSASQIRERLRRRGYPARDIEAAIDRLRRDRVLDDGRVAAARARASIARGRGRLRALREIEALGIDRQAARAAVDAAFAECDEMALGARARARRRRGRGRGPPHARRLHQALLRQGFPPEQVRAALRVRGFEADP